MRLLGLLVAFAALVLGQGTPSLTLTLPAAVVSPGGQVVAQVVLATPSGVLSPTVLEFTLGATRDFTAATAVAGAVATTAGKQITCSAFNATASTLTCIVWGLNTATLANGVVAQVTLTLSPATTAATEALTLTNVTGSDVAGLLIRPTMVGATFPVTPAIPPMAPCDMNGDGAVNLTDIGLVVAQALAGGASCTTGNLLKDGCTILDVYREVLAAMPVTVGIAGSGICRTGP